MILHSLCLFVNFWRFLCLYTHELYYFCKKIPMNDTNLLNKSADNIRVLTAAMVEKAKSGHPGGDRKSTRLNSSHPSSARMPSSA